jgi:hypothetical protein
LCSLLLDQRESVTADRSLIVKDQFSEICSPFCLLAEFTPTPNWLGQREQTLQMSVWKLCFHIRNQFCNNLQSHYASTHTSLSNGGEFLWGKQVSVMSTQLRYEFIRGENLPISTPLLFNFILWLAPTWPSIASYYVTPLANTAC